MAAQNGCGPEKHISDMEDKVLIMLISIGQLPDTFRDGTTRMSLVEKTKIGDSRFSKLARLECVDRFTTLTWSSTVATGARSGARLTVAFVTMPIELLDLDETEAASIPLASKATSGEEMLLVKGGINKTKFITEHACGPHITIRSYLAKVLVTATELYHTAPAPSMASSIRSLLSSSEAYNM